jgi:hypothetical protein
MIYEISQNVLHAIYCDKDIPGLEFKHLDHIATMYEGAVKNRVGFNFPMTIVPKSSPIKKYTAAYVVVYKKGDIPTKKHELRHAMYFLDSNYKDSILSLWKSFSVATQSSIRSMLLKMNYPDNQDILLDEFQAYYFTEKSNFFGKLVYS